MFKYLFFIPLTMIFISHTADIDRQSYITQLEKNWLVLVKETDYSGDVAQEAIYLNNQIKKTMKDNCFSSADITEIECTAIRNANEKNKTNKKAKL